MDMDTTLGLLLGWAATLSGYPLPEDPPSVRFEDHAFFQGRVCRAEPCLVVGFYDDAGTIYIDRRFQTLDEDIGTSLLVHEFTHYLQHRAGAFASGSCAENMAREREAYHIQNRYLSDVLASTDTVEVPEISCTYPNTAAH